MNEEELKRLLEKYYNGESSEEEETALREYFNSAKVPDGYEAEKAIFSYYDEITALPEPSRDFEAQIMSAIDASVRRKSVKRIILPLISAAAGLLLLGGSYFLFVNKGAQDTYSDPEIAYAETVRILNDVSVLLNSGTKALEPIDKLDMAGRRSIQKINNSAKLAEKSLNELNLLLDTALIY